MIAVLTLMSALHGQSNVAAALGSVQGSNNFPVIGTSNYFFRNPIISDGNLTGPEDIGVVNSLKENREFEPLEMSRGFLRRVNTGLFSDRFGIQAAGVRSPIRFQQGKIPHFLVTILPLQQLPTKWECFKLEAKGDGRFLQFNNSGFAEIQGPRGVHVRASSYVGDVYKLKVENLPPGEYAFKYGVDSVEKDLYCFGVDPAN